MMATVARSDVTGAMDASRRRAWFRSALLIGVVYGLIGRLFALPADDVQAWRVAAWVVSGAIYAAQIGYEHFRLRNAPRATALHVAVAVAIGTIALVAGGMLHDLTIASTIRPAWVVALVVLPRSLPSRRLWVVSWRDLRSGACPQRVHAIRWHRPTTE